MPRRTVLAWCLYDWANSAFATTVMAAFFPPYFRALALAAGLPAHAATAAWGYVTAAALLLSAMLAPWLGAIADHTGGRKRYLAVGAGLGVAATAAFALIREGQWALAAALFVAASLGFNGANIFYEALLPFVARGAADIDRVSSRGYALGYVGGGLLLAVHALWVMAPERFGFSGVGQATRVAFLTVAAWWAVFSLPLLLRVPEPPGASGRGEAGAASVRAAVRAGGRRLLATLREVRRHRQLALFLGAFWLYNDGIGTIIKMATAYGDELGIGLPDMIKALVITQFVGIPCTLLCGRLAGRIGAKRTVLLTLAVYVLICTGGFLMRTAGHFYLLAGAVGLVQGGSQALSRSLFGVMTPRHRAAEFFGFFGLSARFAGIAGPLLFGLASQLTGGGRAGILVLIVFFVAGALMLARVDVAAGERAARAEEMAFNR